MHLQSRPPNNKHPPSLQPVLMRRASLLPSASPTSPSSSHPALLTLDLGQLCAQRRAVAVQTGQQLMHLQVDRVKALGLVSLSGRQAVAVQAGSCGAPAGGAVQILGMGRDRK